VEFWRLIVDEAQGLGSSTPNKAFRDIDRIAARSRWLLSGATCTRARVRAAPCGFAASEP
jgi:hypothetical protein